jgi:hypothetical protein
MMKRILLAFLLMLPAISAVRLEYDPMPPCGPCPPPPTKPGGVVAEITFFQS